MRSAWVWVLLLGVGCGSRAATAFVPPDASTRPVPTVEICNGLDDDLDGAPSLRDAGLGMDAGAVDAGPSGELFIDEDFRDAEGRYVDDDHCGACNQPCRPSGEATASACAVVEGSPRCVATACAAGFAPSRTGVCVPVAARLCLTCQDDGDCGDLEGAACAFVGGERRCTIECALGCPDGTGCLGGICVPTGGSCSCDPGDRFDLACALIDPDDNRCPGEARCEDGVLGACQAPDEICDEVDNDCDGEIDEGFRDARGAYSLDVRHCGMCGVDCTASRVPEGDLACGGDPLAPSCVLACPDVEDGIDPGDRVDADRDIATGCECRVGSLVDGPGPVLAEGEALDVNCDGADGDVLRSIYVAPDGDDGAIGSPTRPLRTLAAAMTQAAESLDSDRPRPDVYVASGLYPETLDLPDGVRVHGGYRRDFLALDPDGFRVEIRAPTRTDAPGGAAVVATRAGQRETVLEWVEVQGLDASASGAPAFGIVLDDCVGGLRIEDVTVRTGLPRPGTSGDNGLPGVTSMDGPTEGAEPRAALEETTGDRLCRDVPENDVAGGAGGQNTCDGVNVSGGAGGTADCPRFGAFEARGGNGLGDAGGAGGQGGQSAIGPITGFSCPDVVCCGLADFSVPFGFQGPQPGNAGRSGTSGTAGGGCGTPLGSFPVAGPLTWTGGATTDGTPAQAGSGGGGGGAGGGTEYDWTEPDCTFADGLGGGGGGGGAGGCGGRGGSAGQSAAPAIAVVLRFGDFGVRPPPELVDVTLLPADGGQGGDGGAGGAGGRGQSGAPGGALPLEERSTPTLAGPFPGGRGAPGGDGGDGGGGGGGCGGSSVGIALIGVGAAEGARYAAELRSDNDFTLGEAGPAGRGGGGAAPAGDGADGEALDVAFY